MGKNNENFFLGRQPILNRKQEIVGYELLFRATTVNRAEFESYSQASTSVITSALSNFGLQEVLGGKVGFINVYLGLFLSELLELLPIGQSVLELLENIKLDGQVAERCRELRKLGFKLALDDHVYNPDYHEIYSAVDYVKIDILETSPEQLPEIVRKLRQWPLKLLAEKVETFEQFETCAALGFDYFQGYFFERPVVLNRKRLDVSGRAMLTLLQQLTADAPLEELEQTFKENPSLSYNLLRLVNSVALGMREKIKTLRHAILMLGTNHLRRWIQLSLFSGNDSRGIDNPLLEMAAVRGRLMETLMLQKLQQPSSSEQSEEAFMTGILSLLDVLFETPMDEIISNLNLNEEICSALLDRSGRLGDLLLLAEKLEVTDFDAVTSLLERCGITLDELLAAQLEAFNWRSGIIAH
ncbi:EAL domain-containing protein [Geobacter sp. FeAm09]|uniref:EAL and HDOD domain-containing protein n=1 Tax=Geobacter sp. FeAm09 TaxID=2597769 RepID=UPI0011EDDD09|nr:EAL domain-containing protein [Geobacter sp. FeAm09]QEM67985.1 EAL domain-containing protein [Geobacter sp. FeAm09]